MKFRLAIPVLAIIGLLAQAQTVAVTLDLDHEFDAGSGIVLNELSKIQIDNLTTLGKVWGFLKYHHPAVTAGTRQWDFDLFRIMPTILAAPDRAAANQSLVKWIDGLGGLDACGPSAHLETSEMQLRPALEWLSDESALGPDLSRSLRAIYAARPPEGKQFYVSLVRSIGNPNFLHELGYTQMKPGDAGFQILAAFRFWNIIEYWFPYRDVLGENWDAVLEESIPKIALAKTRRSYEQELMMLIARAHDTHANLWSSLGERPPTGPCSIPVSVRFIENQAVVSSYCPSKRNKTAC